MQTETFALVRDQLGARREKLQAAIEVTGRRAELVRLLDEVDAALHRVELGTYGRCETCHDPIETDRLQADPLVRFCLDHLSSEEQRALEQDLQLAARIQQGLLPDRQIARAGWEVAYHYEPAQIVSGDYCDVIGADGRELYFMLGDVSGKGVAASMLMAHLHAMMRTLVTERPSLDRLLERASRLFCESTLPTHYATLVCGRATADGEVEICNAGHPPPIVARAGELHLVGTTGLPLGLFCAEHFASERFQLAPGDAIVVFTDGLSEAEDAGGREYGVDRLVALVGEHRGLAPADLVTACVRDVRAHRAPGRWPDDVSVMALRRA